MRKGKKQIEHKKADKILLRLALKKGFDMKVVKTQIKYHYLYLNKIPLYV